ncbi:uncharacterized protein K02A2.6-like isoform X3 [Anoplophora glabripennis]|uniref:uncharacterized protein K02A2.6-like isoform X3 n=1 Tax=Anoplophora glabripennis TaxID=217634 RepID=UPI000C781BD0|nr:uncharacterized protein K02A2.6-like isoform X3 [Anoplophora glabripennis]
MALIGQVTEFNLSSDDWTIYSERLTQYFCANKILEEKIKVATLLSVIGTSTYKLVRDLCYPAQPAEKTYQQLTDILKDQLGPRKSIWRERIRFFQLQQVESESVSEFCARIRGQAANCQFDAELEGHLKNKFVTGLVSKAIQDRLCEEPVSKTIKDLVQIALQKEAVVEDSAQVHVLKNSKFPRWKTGCRKESSSAGRSTEGGGARPTQTSTTSQRTRWRSRVQNNDKRQDEPSGNLCKRCNKKHEGQCKYLNYYCNKCGKKGHLKAACREQQHLNYMNILTVQNIINRQNPFAVNVTIDSKIFCMDLDSGASVSCISEKTYFRNFASNYRLSKDALVLKGYNGLEFQPRGYIVANVTYNNITKKVKFYVVHSGTVSILGRDFMKNFKIQLSMVNTVVKGDVMNGLVSKYSDVFSEKLGCFKLSKVSLQLKPGARPVFCKPRNVPIAFKKPLEEELRKLEAEGVISPVESSPHGTPLVVVLKTDGKIRVCGDYKSTVNRYLEEVRYPLPKIDEIFSKLHQGKKFSKIDLSQAYNQFELDDDAKQLLTWSTHKGLYKVNRMPYGISPASAIFQRHLEQLFQGMENVSNFIDDILVTGKDDEEHIRMLDNVLRKLQDAGLTVKADKCKFFQDELEYLGHKITKEGIKKTEDKVEAIVAAPTPTNVSETRSFIGMVNYYSKFIPDLATKLKPIYNLLKKDSKFRWNKECSQVFEEVKHLIAEDMILVHFDPDKPIIVTTDASNYGISATLSHLVKGEEKPVACVSRTLSPSEEAYSTIHKEALAIYFGVRKFQQYLIGHKFTLKCDHKPLLAIFGEYNQIPIMHANRLQRWAIYLANFNYTIQYIKGCNNHLADYLSRAPLRIKTVDKDYEGKENYFNYVHSYEGWPVDSKTVTEESRQDKVLRKVREKVQGNWTKLDEEELRPYFVRKDEIVVEGDMLVWGHRVIIPSRLRRRMLDELHASHLGIAKAKATARSYMWWPKMDEDIAATVKACMPCLHQRADPPKAELTPWQVETEPWSRVHADHLGPLQGKYFLIMVDAYSKFPEVYPVRALASEVTEEKFRDAFSRFGLPRTLVTDNGKSFTAANMKRFYERNGIKHITTPVANPQSNGQAENMVKTFKNKIKAALLDERNKNVEMSVLISRFLLNYRTSIHETTKETPSKLLMGRNLRNRLDFLQEPRLQRNEAVSVNMRRAQEKQRKHYSQSKRRQFKVGEAVMVRDYRKVNTRQWTEAQVERVLGRSTFLCRLRTGEAWKRHSNQIINIGKLQTGREPNEAGTAKPCDSSSKINDSHRQKT